MAYSKERKIEVHISFEGMISIILSFILSYSMAKIFSFTSISMKYEYILTNSLAIIFVGYVVFLKATKIIPKSQQIIKPNK